ncbi:MAG: response regulator transcription factor [Defluviitaleaceae bacterium]|nr:response regulator transcription factor [Defluviitaleaceae bacterium]
MPHIWIVEDDTDIREIILYALNSAGYEATGFERGEDFFTMLVKTDTPPHVVILDIMLPGDDGLAILKRLRHNPQHVSLPVMMLTAKSGELDKVKGLDLGADDYLTKPFSVMELISRIKALLRRSQNAAPTSHALRFQSITMNNNSRTVDVNGAAVLLSFKEYELLKYLLTHPHIVLTRDKILETVWGYDFEGESRTLDMHIKRLRQKLGEAGAYIKTIRNVGYKLGS